MNIPWLMVECSLSQGSPCLTIDLRDICNRKLSEKRKFCLLQTWVDGCDLGAPNCESNEAQTCDLDSLDYITTEFPSTIHPFFPSL